MSLNFKTLNNPDETSEDIERRLTAYDRLSEDAQRGQPAQIPGTVATAIGTGEAAVGEGEKAEKPDDSLENLMQSAKGNVDGSEALASLGIKGGHEQELKDNASSSDEDELLAMVLDGANNKRDVPEVAAVEQSAAVEAKPQVSVGAPSMQSTVGGAVGNLIGRGVAEAAGIVASPFMALSSARRHLNTHFPKPEVGIVPAGPAAPAKSMHASAGVGLPHTLESITSWKCDRIESNAAAVVKAADALMNTDAYVVWQEKLAVKAEQANVGVPQYLSNLMAEWKLGADSSGLKDGMDAIWSAYPNEVKKYRSACDDFERNVRNVVKEFVNSENTIQDRVTTAMKTVEEKTQSLPGFTDNMGEYFKTIAERVRALSQQMREFVAALMSKVSPNSANELTP